MIKYIKYLLVFLLATGFVACSEDEGAQILGSLYEKVDITPEPGMNLVGRVTDGKNPIEGAVVSDGFTVTTTDAQGVYQMRVKKSTPFVFVSVPADCEIPVENGMPKIYKKIALGDNDVVQRSFTLERTGKKERFTLLALADVQIGRDDEVTMLDEEVLPLLIPYVQQELEAPVYGISLGDLVWDNMPFHSVYKEQIRKIGVPVFQVIGNHDHDKAIGMDTEADHSFRAAFGPTYYSYNIGDCHFVVLDDVLYTGSSNYTAEITEAQMAWLEQDLKHVPKDKLIIIGVLMSCDLLILDDLGTEMPTAFTQSALYALLDGYNVRILSGHSHNNYTTTISETIEENTLGAVMGAYWNGEELCNDGSPRGYAVYEIEGNRIANWYYKGTAYPKEYQMYLYGPGQAVSEQYRDGLICTSACIGGEISQYFLQGDTKRAEQALGEYLDIFGPDHFFIELMDHGMEEEQRCNKYLIDLARRNNLKLIATNDVHYMRKEDAEAHEIMLCIQTGARLAEKHFRFPTPEFYFKGEQEMRELFREVPEAITNTRLIAERCSMKFHYVPEVNHYPKFYMPDGRLADRNDLREVCFDNMEYRYGFDPRKISEPDARQKEILDRMEYELGVIEKTGFISYFFVVSDFIRHAKAEDIPVGPGRGSGAGSLVAYLTRITDIDPLLRALP